MKKGEGKKAGEKYGRDVINGLKIVCRFFKSFGLILLGLVLVIVWKRKSPEEKKETKVRWNKNNKEERRKYFREYYQKQKLKGGVIRK